MYLIFPALGFIGFFYLMLRPSKSDLLWFAIICGVFCFIFIMSFSIVFASTNTTTLVSTTKYDLVEVNKYVITIAKGQNNFVYITEDGIISKSLTNVTFIDLDKGEVPFVAVQMYDSRDCPWTMINMQRFGYEIHCNPSQIKVKFTN